MNNSEEVLVVPMEVEVASNAGLYSQDDVLDFGIGGSWDKPKEIRLLLYNSWKKVIRIQVCSTNVKKDAVLLLYFISFITKAIITTRNNSSILLFYRIFLQHQYLKL